MQLSGQCAKCEQIRAYNAAHPEKNYTYYDDYMKDQCKNGASGTTQAPADANKASAATPAATPEAAKTPTSPKQ